MEPIMEEKYQEIFKNAVGLLSIANYHRQRAEIAAEHEQDVFTNSAFEFYSIVQGLAVALTVLADSDVFIEMEKIEKAAERNYESLR